MEEKRKYDLKDRITSKLKTAKSMTFAEICQYVSSFGYTEWEVATTLPALCKEGYFRKVTQKIKKRKFFNTTEITETRYYLN